MIETLPELCRECLQKSIKQEIFKEQIPPDYNGVEWGLAINSIERAMENPETSERAHQVMMLHRAVGIV